MPNLPSNDEITRFDGTFKRGGFFVHNVNEHCYVKTCLGLLPVMPRILTKDM